MSARPAISVLHHGGLAAEIAPDLGGTVLSLAIGGKDVLRRGAREAVAADPRAAASFPCLPWFGRLFGGLTFGESRWDVAPTLPACDPRHPLHGEAWTRPWAVTAHTDVFLECRFASDGVQEGRFPFAYEARQIAQIAEGAFGLALILRNSGAAPMPAGLGLHPYFPRRAETALAFAAGGLWTPAPEGGGAESAIPPELDFAQGAPLPARAIDHSFTGFQGRIEIRQPDMTVRLAADAPILHVYAPAGADFFCLEPVTHLPGAFGSDVLAPKEQMRLSLNIAAEPR